MDIAAFKRELFAITYDLQKILHDTMTPICQEHGLTLQQMHVLVELMRTPGLTAGQLSDRAVQRRYGRAFSAEPQETFDAILEGFQALSAFSGKLVR